MKKIPEEKVKAFIALDRKMDKLKVEYEASKVELRDYYSRGFTSPLIKFKESTRQQIDWKLLVSELCAKFMKPAQVRVFFSSLKKRFPREPIAPTIIVVGKPKKTSSSSERES